MSAQSTAVLLVNTGSPRDAHPISIKNYLREFLSDKRIVDLPSWKWKPILHGIILRTRPQKTSLRYKKLELEGKEDLISISNRQAQLLEASLQADGDITNKPRVYACMRYGEPSLRSRINELCKEGIDKLIVLPMFAQHAAVTTGTIFQVCLEELKDKKHIPDLHLISHYCDDKSYIEALRQSLSASLAQMKDTELLVLSYHSTLMQDIEAGDPYQDHCIRSSKALAQALGLTYLEHGDLKERKQGLIMGYQSIFDKRPWLRPLSLDLVQEALSLGYTKVYCAAPGFTTDCLETWWDLDHELASQVKDLGYKASFEYLPALNDHPAFIAHLHSRLKSMLY